MRWLVKLVVIPFVAALTEWFTERKSHDALEAAVTSLQARVDNLERLHSTPTGTVANTSH